MALWRMASSSSFEGDGGSGAAALDRPARRLHALGAVRDDDDVMDDADGHADGLRRRLLPRHVGSFSSRFSSPPQCHLILSAAGPRDLYLAAESEH